MQKLFIASLFLGVNLFASTLHIAVAANVSYAIKPLLQTFKQQHPSIDVEVNLGSSGKLTAQIMHGARYDIFLSANMLYPDKLAQNGFTLKEPKVYAQGALVLLSTQKRDFSQGLTLLQSPSIRRVAMANPKTAPYGKAALEVLQKSGLYETIHSKLIYGESVGQTLSFTITAADIGFVAKSALFAPQMKKYNNKAHSYEINTQLYSPIKQGIVLLKHAKGNKEASTLYNYFFSPTAQTILQNYGYTLP